MRRTLVLGLALGILAGSCAHHPAASRSISEHDAASPRDTSPRAANVSRSTPLALPRAETFTIDSTILHETRRINVLLPTIYGAPVEGALPTLYMPDGGLDEDFLHIAGLVQVLTSNGAMRPVILVGIENTQRRRDLTGPTQNPEDRAIAPVVGGSAAFRGFLRDELMPAVRAKYRTTQEAGIVGESLAGLFVLETLFEDPDLFQNYIAVDPSLWWNDGGMTRAATAARAEGFPARTVMVITSGEPSMAQLNTDFAAAMEKLCTGACRFFYLPMPSETHATIYHPAALTAFRTLLAPTAKPAHTAP
ncbi:MAG TPA: alpha/beta hydrolase-fold protein [Phycisphaerales bacterium]|nr:alpha/beta hydrolase-fold protein [Phycisphaerales bacterium]